MLTDKRKKEEVKNDNTSPEKHFDPTVVLQGLFDRETLVDVWE